MTEIWHCPPDWAAWLTGSLFGLFVGGGIGWYLRSCFRKVEPVVDPTYFKGGSL